ncbi:MAG: response regulator [Burkholderiaceae bacterium]
MASSRNKKAGETGPLADERDEALAHAAFDHLLELARADTRDARPFARERLQAMRDFAAGLVDALDDVLLPIDLQVEALQARAHADHETPWRRLAQARERAGALTDALRAFARRLSPQPRPFGLARLLDRLLARHRVRLADGVGLHVSCHPADLTLAADAALIEYSLDLLLDEAGQLTGPGGTIEVRAHRHELAEPTASRLGLHAGGIVHLVVSDRPPTHAAGVTTGTHDPTTIAFEPLVSQGRSDSRFGLVWAIADGIVASHGGRLIAEAIDGGVCIHLLLPSGGGRESDGVAQALQGSRVLVVDDERLVRYAIVRMLDAAGLRVLTADGGREALQTLDRGGVDLVLLDMNLTDMSGSDCLTEMRARLPMLPVIAMSGMPIGADHPLQADPRCRTLEKPFLSAELRAMVDDLLLRAHGPEKRLEADTLSSR